MRLEHPLDQDRGPFLERGRADALALRSSIRAIDFSPMSDSGALFALPAINRRRPPCAALPITPSGVTMPICAEPSRREVVTLSVAPVIWVSDMMP
jgi:hypothetical protein